MPMMRVKSSSGCTYNNTILRQTHIHLGCKQTSYQRFNELGIMEPHKGISTIKPGTDQTGPSPTPWSDSLSGNVQSMWMLVTGPCLREYNSANMIYKGCDRPLLMQWACVQCHFTQGVPRIQIAAFHRSHQLTIDIIISMITTEYQHHHWNTGYQHWRPMTINTLSPNNRSDSKIKLLESLQEYYKFEEESMAV